MTQAPEMRSLPLLKSSFISTTKEGGLPWGIPYLITLGWIDVLLSLSAAVWKSEALYDALSFLVAPIGSIVMFVVLLNLIDDNPCWHRLWRKTWLVFCASAVSAVVIVAGLVFLVIPGVVFAKWYFYAPFVAARSSVGPIEAMALSKRLSRVNGWRALIVWVAMGMLFAGLNLATKNLVATFPDFFAFKVVSEWIEGGTLLIFLNEFLNTWAQSVLLPVFGCLMCIQAERNSSLLEGAQPVKSSRTMRLSSRSSRENRLEELKDLWQKGLIDEADYREAKRKELGL